MKIPGWFSFNSKDGVNVVSGDSIKECVAIAETCEKVVAVGINCTPPRFIEGLVLEIKKVICLERERDRDRGGASRTKRGLHIFVLLL